jgi:cytochrome c oxidase subunit III
MSAPTTQERLGQGGGGVHPPGYGGGGDSGPGDGFSDYERRLHRARLGLILGIVSITMLFITATAVFLLRHAAVVVDPHSGFYVHQWLQVELPVRLLLLNTCVLLLSSFTMELARRSVGREMVFSSLRAIPGVAWEPERRIPWLGMTVLLGVVFLVGQGLAWQALRSRGFHASTAGLSPFFYLLTGAHAAHLAVGILVLFYAGMVSLFRGSIEHRRIVVETAAWYWHFMGVLWLYVFALLQFGR